MKSYIIVYKASTEAKQKALVDGIKLLADSWARITDGCYVVGTSKYDSRELRDRLAHDKMTTDDRLLIVNITESGWASYGLPTEVSKYLKDNV